MPNTNRITAIQALGVATTEIASLDAELDQLLAAIRAFRGKAARVTRRVHARAEAVSDAIHGAREEREARLIDADAADQADERLLDALAELPSAAPDDCAAAASEALTEYRRALRELAAASGAMTGGGASSHGAANV